MSSNSAISLLAAVGVLVPAVAAQAAQWRPVGQQYVDFRTNPVVIQVEPAHATFAKLRLQVRGHSLEIDTVKLFLANGKSFDVTLDSWVGPGQETRVIKVPDGPEAVRKVQFTYRNGSASEDVLPLVRLVATS
jgi:hypothetical protein